MISDTSGSARAGSDADERCSFRGCVRVAILPIILFVAASPLDAQRLCLRPSDGPECYAFVLEVHFGIDLLNRFELSPGPYSSIGLGVMRNVGSDWAVGALMDYQFSRPVSSYGYRLRGRWRQTEEGEELGGVDVEAGVLRSRKWPMTASNAKPLVREDERGWGITTGVRANVADRVLIFIRHDVTWMQPLAPVPQPSPLEPYGPAHVRHALFLGGGGGSEVGLALTLPWLFFRVDTACHRGVYC